MPTHNPKVFISYSHDSDTYRAEVLAFATRLRDEGIDCRIDREYEDEPPAKGWSRWMLDSLDWAEFVLVICTETYYQRFRGHAPQGTGKGVKWEGAIITQELYDNELHNLKYVPVLFEAIHRPHIPEPLRPTDHYLATTDEGYQKLYRRITKQKRYKPQPPEQIRTLPPEPAPDEFVTKPASPQAGMQTHHSTTSVNQSGDRNASIGGDVLESTIQLGDDNTALSNRLKLVIPDLQSRSSETSGEVTTLTLPSILLRAQNHLVISGHTLDKFARNIEVRLALLTLLARGVKLSIIQLNPLSRYALAHQPYHELESTSSAAEQHDKTLQFFESVFEDMDSSQRNNLEVVFSNYMSRFRTIIVDDAVFLYLYMYGVDVSQKPDFILDQSAPFDGDLLRQRVVFSTLKLLNAPEAVPYIRGGRVFKHWAKSKLASWDSWTQNERVRHRLTHEFYVTNAQNFHNRFGRLLEREVCAHLEQVDGRTLVLGCGSGKEVEYLSRHRPQDDVYGIDFSPIAIDLAKDEYPHLANRFLLGDFYDLYHILPGQFDSIVANAAFVHLYNRDDINVILKEVWEKLVNGGTFFLRTLYKERNGVPIEQEVDNYERLSEKWLTSRWFVYFSRAELAERCRCAGFEVLNEITESLAKREYGSGRKQMADILGKGFPHVQYRNVFWPTLLLRKK